MRKDVETLINRIKTKNKTHKIWKSVVSMLSCIAVFVTIYALMTPAKAESTVDGNYKMHLIDSYDFEWKHQDKYTTAYDLDISFVDDSGNPLQGSDLTINIGPDNLADDPYAFGYVPFKSDGTAYRGKNLIDEFNLYEVKDANGDYYEFDHVEVYVNGAWQTFATTGNHWHIYCGNSGSNTEPTTYGWRGQYNENTAYTITNDTKYKFVYKYYRFGDYKNEESLGAGSGITFKLFDYTGDNTENDIETTGNINANGIYDVFNFRNSSISPAAVINNKVDADGYYEEAVQKDGTIKNRAHVEGKLVNGYPVFDCKTKGECSTNPSLGYLFGATTNPEGDPTKGVTSYNPVNTILQTEMRDNVKYYYYDSKRNAVDYDTYTNTFNVRNYVERSYSLSGYKNESARNDFLPFNHLSSLTTQNHPKSGLPYNYEQTDINHWFGMTMEFEFKMPKDGKINDEAMVFEFSGDDDVWVFIDNVLVLDLGGTHGAVDGSINFATGEVEGYLNWDGTTGNEENKRWYSSTIYEMFEKAGATGEVEWNDTNTTFKNYKGHTLKFFYLERGAAVANNEIYFNIPVLPSGGLSVQKQYEGTDDYNEEFEFTLYDATNETAVPVANTNYTINDVVYSTDENGKFRLTTGQEAIFTLTNDHTYYVEETDTGEHSVSHSCTLEGDPCETINQTQKFTIDPESSYQAIFTNKIKTYDLNVSKKAYGETDESFEFQLNLSKNGSPIDIPDDIESKYVVNHTDGIVTFYLKSDETITIKDIPVDTNIVLTETKHDGYQTVIKTGDQTLTSGDTHEFVLTTDSYKDITVHNIPGVMLPETGGSGIVNYIIFGASLILLSLFGYRYCNKSQFGVR